MEHSHSVFKKVKKIFYILFMLDVLAGCVVGFFLNIISGLIVAAVLIFINSIVCAIVFKMEKVVMNAKK
jgi:hypothetical protein